MGEFSGLIQEQILHHDTFHCGQCRRDMLGIRIGLNNVFTLAIQTKEAAVNGGIEHVGQAQPRLEGSWFPDGFHGTMAELLCAIEENREPSNSAANNLQSLALAFAAMASAGTGKPEIPGEHRKFE